MASNPSGYLIDIGTLHRNDFEALWEQERKQNPHLQHIEQIYQAGTLPSEKGEAISIFPGAIELQDAKILYTLARKMHPKITVETGFGYGMSAWTFLAAHAATGSDAHHIAIDPFYPHWTQSVGKLHLEKQSFSGFHLLEHNALVALPHLISEGLLQDLCLAFIDGSHLFEQAMVDFCMLDHMLVEGGILVLDDAHAPAIETLLNYIEANRQEYRIRRDFSPIAILQKRGPDERSWSHFVPFQSASSHQWPTRKK